MTEHFAWRRLAVLLRNDAIGNYRYWLLGSVVAVGALLLVAMAAAMNDNDTGSPVYQSWFYIILMTWGSIASSIAFRDLHDKTKNSAYLLLPASALEKTLAPLLYLTVGLFGYLLLLMTVASLAIEAVNSYAFGRTNQLFLPFDSVAWSKLPEYVVLQSWFFLGAAWFRKAHYLKTVLAILTSAVGMLALFVLSLWIVGTLRFDGGSFNVVAAANVSEWMSGSDRTAAAAVETLVTLGYFVVLPIFCWFVAWLRIRETQVSHGV